MASIVFPKTLRAITQDYQEFQTPLGASCEATVRQTASSVAFQETWTATGSMTTSRTGVNGCGTQMTALTTGGGASYNSTIERHNGSTWVLSGSLASANYSSGTLVGFFSAAMYSGGLPNGVFTANGTVQLFNGASWSNSGSMNRGRFAHIGFGNRNAAVMAGGNGPTNTTETFNGSAWTNAANMNQSKFQMGGIGVASSGMVVGGRDINQNALSTTEIFNGSTWASGPTTLYGGNGPAATGTVSNALVFGGGATYASTAGCAKLIAGVFSATTAMGTARANLSGAGTANLAIAAGGESGPISPTYYSTAEKFFSSVSISTFVSGSPAFDLSGSVLGGGSVNITQKILPMFESEIEQQGRSDMIAWAATGNLNTARQYLAACGSRDSMIAFGGNSSSTAGLGSSERYNGSTWSNTASASVLTYSHGGSGYVNAALKFGGQHSGANLATSELFNGFVWSSRTSMNTARNNVCGVGSERATLSVGGFAAAYSAVCEKYNGTAWSVTGSLSQARNVGSCSGGQNTALAIGGNNGANQTTVELFNGSTWSSGNAIPVATRESTAAGSQSDSVVCGGFDSNYTAQSYLFNGSTWSTSITLNTARRGLASGGASQSMTSCGGFTGSNSAVTERRLVATRPSAYYNAFIESTVPLA